jgi:hypothetical protein
MGTAVSSHREIGAKFDRRYVVRGDLGRNVIISSPSTSPSSTKSLSRAWAQSAATLSSAAKWMARRESSHCAKCLSECSTKSPVTAGCVF